MELSEQNLETRMLLKFCNQKNLWAITWFKKKKMTYSSGGYETEINFVLVEKERRKFLKDVKVIFWELQQRIVAVDVKKKNLF